MTASELKTSLAKQLRELALWRNQKNPDHRLNRSNQESVAALSAMANALSAVPDTHPALLDILSLHSAEFPATPVSIPHNLVFRAFGFAAVEGGDVGIFLGQIAQAMCAQYGRAPAR